LNKVGKVNILVSFLTVVGMILVVLH
jgi:hypothetical protein